MIYLGNQAVGVAVDGKSVNGTFTGDGTQSVSLNIGFAPSMLIINSGLDYSVTGWVGIGDIVFEKGRLAFDSYHSNDTVNAPTVQINEKVGGTYGDYGSYSSAGTYRAYGEYSNGAFTVYTKGNAANMKFISGQAYSWKAYA